MAIPDYPNDADGDALRRVAADGNDMSKPMLIDFSVAVPSERAGRGTAEAAARLGYQTDVVHAPGEVGFDEPSWTCYCSRTMVPIYDELIAAQEELTNLSRPYGGACDGGVTFGNRKAV